MGACDISFELDKKATRDEIEKAFKNQKENDTEENGHAHGYSGDFQTVGSIDYHLENVFPSAEKAYEYCLEHAVKWSTVVAVYYKEETKVKGKKVEKIKAKLNTLRLAAREVENIGPDTTKPFRACSGCKSRLSIKHIKGNHCPLCGFDLRPKSIQNKLNKIHELEKKEFQKLGELQTKENEKNLKSNKGVKTLVAGWGAC